MANVKENESAARIITDGNYKYMLYPDFGVNDLATPKWGIQRADITDPDDIIFGWAEGSKDKRFAANALSSLTYKNLE